MTQSLLAGSKDVVHVLHALRIDASALKAS